MIPNFLLLGPGRTGTSWVAKNLMLHPEICFPREKTTRFLTANYDKGIAWYESRFAPAKAIGESIGSDILEHPEILPRIKEHMPDAKLISTFRNPVDRAYSAMGRLRAEAKQGEMNATIDFEEKLKVTPRLVNQGLYATRMDKLHSMFPKEQHLILFYDQLRDDPRGFLRKIYEFLGVDPDFESPLLHQSINATATFAAKSKLRKAAYRLALRLELFKLAKRIDSTMQNPQERLTPDVRRRVLQTYFMDDINRLEQMLGTDLSSWRVVSN